MSLPGPKQVASTSRVEERTAETGNTVGSIVIYYFVMDSHRSMEHETTPVKTGARAVGMRGRPCRLGLLLRATFWMLVLR